MSFRIGLGSSRKDIEVQGEVDFDFFDGVDSPPNSTLEESKNNVNETKKETVPERNNATVSRTRIETTIPTPEQYKGNNCVPPKYVNSSKREEICVKHPIVPYSVSETTLVEDNEAPSEETSLTKSDSSTVWEWDEEDDSLTDVSHCSSPLILGQQHHHPNSHHSTNENNELTENRRKKVMPQASSGSNRVPPKTNLLAAIKNLKIKETTRKPKVNNILNPLFAARKSLPKHDLTYTNEEIRIISRENQRLLTRIEGFRKNVKPKSSSAPRITAAAKINRLEAQRKIDLENQAMLKRLNTTKVSKELSRIALLKDYDKRSTISSRGSSRCSSINSSQTSSCRTSALSYRSEKSSTKEALSPMPTTSRSQNSQKKPDWQD